jgi:uncharacterized membrane protein
LKDDYFPIIVLMVLLPLFFSPISLEAVQVEDEEVNVIIQFQTSKNVTEWQSIFSADIENQIKDPLELWGETNFPDFQFEFNKNHQVYLLEFEPISGISIIELNTEGIFEGDNNNNEEMYASSYDALVSQLRDILVPILITNGATNGTSFLDFKSGEVITNEF